MRCAILAIGVLVGCDRGKSPAAEDTSGAFDGIVQIANNVPTYETRSAHIEIAGSAVISEDGTALAGIVDDLRLVDGEVLCDARVELYGISPYEGICDGCEYAFDLNFDIDATVVEDHGTDRCALDGHRTFVDYDWDGWRNPRLGFASDALLYRPGEGGWTPETDVMWAILGRELDDGTYEPGPYYFVTAYDDAAWAYGTADYSDHLLTWTFNFDDDYLQLQNYQYCRTATNSIATEPYDGESVEGTITCNHDEMDGWSFWAKEGQTITATVDADVNEFYAGMFVNGPDGCGVVRAKTNYTCTTGLETGCPSAKFIAPSTGAYEVWVYGFSNCLPVDVHYILTVGGLADSSP